MAILKWFSTHYAWLAHLAAVVVLAINSQSVANFAAHYPAYSAVILAVWGVLLAWAKSPIQQATPPTQ